MSGAPLYREAELEGRGRGLVAVVDIQPGQLIFREEAVAVGPLHDRRETVTARRETKAKAAKAFDGYPGILAFLYLEVLFHLEFVGNPQQC